MKTKNSVMVVLAVLIMSFSSNMAWGAEKMAPAGQADDGKWLFLCYWELNQDIPIGQKLQAEKIIMESGLFPPKNMEIIRFDITPGSWGVTLFKTDSPVEVFEFVNVWKAAVPGFFTTIKVSPALPLKETVPGVVQIFKGVKAAEAKAKAKK